VNTRARLLRGYRHRDAWPWLSLPLLLFWLLPLAALALRVTPASFAEHLADPAVQQAIALSARTTLVTTGVTLLAGTPLAYWLARGRSRARRVIDALVDLPVVLPPSVAGVALLMAFGRRGLFGPALEAAGLSLAFTEAAVVLAQVFVAAPLYVRAATLGFAAVDRELEQAAALDGANGAQVFGEIMLPLARTAMLGGAVLAWARALGEFGATIMFAGNFPGRTQTMPLAIYIGFELDLDVALTLAVILVGCAFVVLAVVRGVLRSEGEAASG
jgi:molybdate transport system permease protein